MSKIKKRVDTVFPDASFANIPLDLLIPNEYNARRFTENMTPQRLAKFNELVASVREKRIIEPLLVRPIGSGRFEIIAGERRFRAALQVVESSGSSLTDYHVPCMVREVNDDDAFDLMIIENMQRDDLTSLETAQAFSAYLERHGNTADAVSELALRTGIPIHAIRRQVRHLNVPAEVISAWKEGVISQSHVDLFTRVGDSQQTLELLSACQRSKLSCRELAERIGAASPDLERGFFEKSECQVCHYNTSVQSGLFSDVTPGGKCSNASCFEARQGTFLTENWLQSKAAAMFGTRGFRFGHRLGQERCEPVTREPASRCLECDQFVSILRLNGAVVSGYSRTCTGPVACFEELFRENASISIPEKTEKKNADDKWPELPATVLNNESSSAQSVTPQPTSGTKIATTKTTVPSQSPPNAASPQTGPVYNALRGEKFREAYFHETIPAAVHDTAPHEPNVKRLTLLAMALASKSAKKILVDHHKFAANLTASELAAQIFDELAPEELLPALRACALAKIMDTDVQPTVRRVVAGNFGIDISSEWAISTDYLDALTKSEIISVGEEPVVRIWSDPLVQAYRKKHHKRKALLSLSKGELVEMVMKSGVDLVGRVPEEVLGARV